jgi:hypothetical protein
MVWWAEPLEPFCAKLASNDPNLKAVDCDVVCLSEDSAENSLRIGKAIQGNTVVSSLTLIPSRSSSKVHTLLQQFIRNSTSLSTCMFMPKSYGIDDGAEAGVMVEYLEAVKDHGKISQLFLGVAPPPHAFASLLGSTRTIKQLFLNASQRLGEEEEYLIVSAFRCNLSLDILTLGHQCSLNLVRSILYALVLHPRIRELRLKLGSQDDIRFMSALCVLIGCTRTLSQVVIADFSFRNVSFGILAYGLRATRTLRHISLMNCEFDGPACESLIQFLQAHKAVHTLRKLSVEDHGDESFMNVGMKAFTDAMFSIPSPPSMHPTVGSSLRSLSLMGIGLAFVGLWRGIETHAANIHLSNLECDVCDLWDWDAMNRCLPKLVHLKKIRIGHKCRYADLPSFMEAIRQNGTLHRIHITDYMELGDYDDEYDGCFSASDRRKLKGYIKRNRLLAALVEKPAFGTIESQGSEDKSLLPTLLFVAQQTPTTTPNVMLRAGLAWAHRVGPKTDRKRRVSLYA